MGKIQKVGFHLLSNRISRKILVNGKQPWFSCRFGLKTGVDFAHFGLESGMVFEETTKVYERICRFNSK